MLMKKICRRAKNRESRRRQRLWSYDLMALYKSVYYYYYYYCHRDSGSRGLQKTELQGLQLGVVMKAAA